MHLEIENIHFGYPSRAREALTGVSLSVPEGGVLGLIGPNGSGKSTLLRCIYRALRPRVGRVLLLGEDVRDFSSKRLARRIAVATQEEAAVPLTTAEYVLLGRSAISPAWKSYSTEDRDCAASALERFGLSRLSDRSILELSGGERKRAMLARALVQSTPVLLLDEPTNHLDVRFQHEILDLVASLRKTCIIVLHDLNLAARYCDRLALLDSGRLVASGEVDDVLRPEILEPVYGLDVHRIEIKGSPQFLMSPRNH